jgi:hypothetical protein
MSLEVHYRVHNSTPMVRIANRMNPAHTKASYFYLSTSALMYGRSFPQSCQQLHLCCSSQTLHPAPCFCLHVCLSAYSLPNARRSKHCCQTSLIWFCTHSDIFISYLVLYFIVFLLFPFLLEHRVSVIGQSVGLLG